MGFAQSMAALYSAIATRTVLINQGVMTKKLKIFGFLALIGAAIALEIFQRGNLADPVPFALTLLGALCGASLGYLAATAAVKAKVKEKRYRKLIVLLSFPLVGIFAGTLLMRSLVLQAAFAGVQTTPEIAFLHVVETQEQSKRTFLEKRYRYIVSLPDGQRSFRVLVDRALFDKVGSRKPPVTVHCIRLPMETGRWDIRRVNGPNYFDTPLGIQHYHACKDKL